MVEKMCQMDESKFEALEIGSEESILSSRQALMKLKLDKRGQ